MEYGWATTAASKLMQTQRHEFLRAGAKAEGRFVRRGLKMGPSHFVKKDLARSKAPSSRLWGAYSAESNMGVSQTGDPNIVP